VIASLENLELIQRRVTNHDRRYGVNKIIASMNAMDRGNIDARDIRAQSEEGLAAEVRQVYPIYESGQTQRGCTDALVSAKSKSRLRKEPALDRCTHVLCHECSHLSVKSAMRRTPLKYHEQEPVT